MPSKIKIFSYSKKSKSAKALSTGLDAKRIYKDRDYYHFVDEVIINWGNSYLPSWWRHVNHFLNHPKHVAKATNKISSFTLFNMNNVNTLVWTTSQTEAESWLNNNEIIYVRETVTGSAGKGITIVKRIRDEFHLLPLAPLYTKWLNHDREFRIHVVKGKVIDAVEKRQRDPEVPADMWIRSNTRGWKFNRRVDIPQDVKVQAIKAVKALGLDFGAVDIGFKSNENKAYVFEVNTAPGIEQTTLYNYLEAFKNTTLI